MTFGAKAMPLIHTRIMAKTVLMMRTWPQFILLVGLECLPEVNRVMLKPRLGMTTIAILHRNTLIPHLL